MDDVTIARAIHVLSIIHWIGGVTMVTLVLLPAILRDVKPEDRLALFERIEGRFGSQARISTALAGLSGFWMTYRLDAWDRFADPDYWWMHAMLLVWMLFTFVLFVAEPLFLHRWFRQHASKDAELTFRLVLRFHRILLTVSLVAAASAVLGAHGAI